MTGNATGPGGLQPDRAGHLLGYPISGMVAYGAIGALLARLTHFTAAFPIGLFVGLVLGIALMIYRYRRLDEAGGDRIDR